MVSSRLMAKEKCGLELVLNADDERTDPFNFRITPVQSVISAFVGAVATAVAMTPLDVVKTRLQAQQGRTNKYFFYCNGLMDHLCPNVKDKDVWFRRPSKFSSTLDGIMKIYKNEGFFSLWSGLSPTLALALPATVLYFALYEELKFWMSNEQTLRNIVQPLWVPLISASAARFFTTLFASPLELIRTKMQAKNMRYLELHHALAELVHQEGYKGLWKGVSATLVRDVAFSGIYWFTYENIKVTYYFDFNNAMIGKFLAGSTAGVISSVVTTPIDVVKTQIQIQSTEAILSKSPEKPNIKMIPVFRQIYKEGGVKGLFAGLTPRTIRIVPSCAIMITAFEYGKYFFHNNSKDVK